MDELKLVAIMRNVPYHDIVSAAEWLDHPAEGIFAAALWRFCNLDTTPLHEGERLMRDCGYIPYSGYPLSRCGKLPSRFDGDNGPAERFAEGMTNPLLVMWRKARAAKPC